MWIFLAFCSAFFAGITAILAKIGIRDTDSTLATALRTIVIFVFSLLFAWWTGALRGIFEMGARTIIFLTLSGLATGASWLCYFRALQLGSVHLVAPVDKFSTVLTMLLAIIFLGEKLTVIGFVALLLITVGTYLCVCQKEKSPPTSGAKKSWFFYAALSALFASLTAILGKIGISNVDSNLGTAFRTGVVLLMVWIIVFAFGKQKGLRSTPKKSLLFIALSGITTCASLLCYFRALQGGPASIVAPIDKLSILVTFAFSALVLKERQGKRTILGLAILTVGTLILLI